MLVCVAPYPGLPLLAQEKPFRFLLNESNRELGIEQDLMSMLEPETFLGHLLQPTQSLTWRVIAANQKVANYIDESMSEAGWA